MSSSTNRDSVLSMSCFSSASNASVNSSVFPGMGHIPFPDDNAGADEHDGSDIIEPSNTPDETNPTEHLAVAVEEATETPLTGKASISAPALIKNTGRKLRRTNDCTLVTSVKKNTRFNIGVVGGSGVGKTSFGRTLFRRLDPNYFSPSKLPKPPKQTTRIGQCGKILFEDKDANESIMITIIDTVGGYSMTEHIMPIQDYLVKQHEAYEKKELFRKSFERGHEDTRIACLFYFFQPHRVHDDDIVFLKSLHDKVPIVPIVSKSDSLTVNELEDQLKTIRKRLKDESIQYFDFEEEEIDESWLDEKEDSQVFANVGKVMAASGEVIPAPPERRMVKNIFAVISNEREYIWGTAREDDPAHSDTMRLHKVLFSSLGKLADKMDDIHEDWRKSRPKSGTHCKQNLVLAVAAVSIVAVVVMQYNVPLLVCQLEAMVLH